MARRICNFCREFLHPPLRRSENGCDLQEAYTGEGGSNTYVISILLILSLNVLWALSWAQLCPATTTGSKAQIPLKAKCKHLSVYLFTQFPTHSETPDQFTHILVQVFSWRCCLLSYRSVFHQLYIDHRVWKWPRNLKTKANIVVYLQEDWSANHVLHPSENSDL